MEAISELDEARAYADEAVKSMPPGEERDELWAFHAFQYGGLKVVGEIARSHVKRTKPSQS